MKYNPTIPFSGFILDGSNDMGLSKYMVTSLGVNYVCFNYKYLKKYQNHETGIISPFSKSIFPSPSIS